MRDLGMKAGVSEIPSAAEVIAKRAHRVIGRADVYARFAGRESEKTVGKAQQSDYTGRQ